MSLLAADYLSKQDHLLLDMLRFLCLCVTASQSNTVSFRATDIKRKLLMLLDSSTLDLTKSIHLHMVSQVEEAFWFFFYGVAKKCNSWICKSGTVTLKTCLFFFSLKDKSETSYKMYFACVCVYVFPKLG